MASLTGKTVPVLKKPRYGKSVFPDKKFQIKLINNLNNKNYYVEKSNDVDLCSVHQLECKRAKIRTSRLGSHSNSQSDVCRCLYTERRNRAAISRRRFMVGCNRLAKRLDECLGSRLAYAKRKRKRLDNPNRETADQTGRNAYPGCIPTGRERTDSRDSPVSVGGKRHPSQGFLIRSFPMAGWRIKTFHAGHLILW